MSLNKTSIEWVKNPDGTQGYTSNPIKGYCPIGCSYCYARRLYNRFGWDKTIRLDERELYAIANHKKPVSIFLGSTFEIFWDGIDPIWLEKIFETIHLCPQHRFYLLTKQPQNLPQWSPFPDNCWVGVTATDRISWVGATRDLEKIEARVKYISLEPYLSPILPEKLLYMMDGILDWVIIGGQSGKNKFYPPEDWIQEIEQACDKARIPIFEKDNLRKVWYNYPKQEMPLEGNYANRRTTREG